MKRGRIIVSGGKWYRVRIDNDELDCRLRGKMRLQHDGATNPVAVGDLVMVSLQNDGTGLIEKVEPRENILPRQAAHNHRGWQILAANIDRAWVVVSIRKPNFKYGFIDRFLVTCEAYEVPCGIILNKMDLAAENDRLRVDHLTDLYEELGYPVLKTSIIDPKSIDRLHQELQDRISVFIGPSGAGKSSLLNAIDPELDLRTDIISEYNEKGQHTTTTARLVELQGGQIIDTPGIRELGLVNISPEELSLYFPEMLEPAKSCKFYNCTHSHEPGCQVMSALDQGKIDPERYNSYLQIFDSLSEIDS